MIHYTTEEHEEAKRLRSLNGPMAIAVLAGRSERLHRTVFRDDTGHIPYLPQARRNIAKRSK